ncbi:hypothetical protein PanWU01x14_180600, partial [Parasponia andersonii]
MIGSHSQGRSRGSSSTSLNSSQPLPPANPLQSFKLNQYIELNSDIGLDDENFKILEWWQR